MELTVVDAFTTEPFTGNPAAVTILEAFPDDIRMQAVAREINLSETAFIVRRADGDHDLRWFTPTVEVELCGHATLASAHVLGGSGRFHTRSGLLVCRTVDDDWIEMDLSADPPTPAPLPLTLGLAGVRWHGLGREDALIALKVMAQREHARFARSWRRRTAWQYGSPNHDEPVTAEVFHHHPPDAAPSRDAKRAIRGRVRVPWRGRAKPNRDSSVDLRKRCEFDDGVDLRGLEPLTSSMPWRRSTGLSYRPRGDATVPVALGAAVVFYERPFGLPASDRGQGRSRSSLRSPSP